MAKPQGYYVGGERFLNTSKREQLNQTSKVQIENK